MTGGGTVSGRVGRTGGETIAHIPDGVLSYPVLIAGAVAAAGSLSLALRRLDYERVPQAAVLASAFFVASLVNVPVGPSSMHLMLTGLMGLILGWAAVPAILVVLVLQTVFFGYGGVLVLGVNTMNLALPALACAALFRPALARVPARRRFWVGASAGALGAILTGAMVSASLVFSGKELMPAARVILAAYLPMALVEAAVTGAAVAFLGRVTPEVLSLPHRRDPS